MRCAIQRERRRREAKNARRCSGTGAVLSPGVLGAEPHDVGPKMIVIAMARARAYVRWM